jgi:hypothetical protein
MFFIDPAIRMRILEIVAFAVDSTLRSVSAYSFPSWSYTESWLDDNAASAADDGSETPTLKIIYRISIVRHVKKFILHG